MRLYPYLSSLVFVSVFLCGCTERVRTDRSRYLIHHEGQIQAFSLVLLAHSTPIPAPAMLQCLMVHADHVDDHLIPRRKHIIATLYGGRPTSITARALDIMESEKDNRFQWIVSVDPLVIAIGELNDAGPNISQAVDLWDDGPAKMPMHLCLVKESDLNQQVYRLYIDKVHSVTKRNLSSPMSLKDLMTQGLWEEDILSAKGGGVHQ